MLMYVFTDIRSNRSTIVDAVNLDEAWRKYILKYYAFTNASDRTLSDIRKELEHDTIISEDVTTIS